MANEYFVSGTGPGMVGVLDSGGAEVVAGYVPYVADMVLKKIGRVLFTGSDAIGRAAPGDGFIVSTKFIKEHPEAVKRRAARAVRGDRLHQVAIPARRTSRWPNSPRSTRRRCAIRSRRT